MEFLDILGQIMRHIPWWVWCKDISGNYLFVNDAFLVGNGLRLEEVIGRSDFNLWPAEEARHFFNRDQEVIRQKMPVIVVEETPGTHDVKRVLETIKFPLFDGDGHVLGTCGIARDIGADRLYRHEIQQKLRDLEKLARRGR